MKEEEILSRLNKLGLDLEIEEIVGDSIIGTISNEHDSVNDYFEYKDIGGLKKLFSKQNLVFDNFEFSFDDCLDNYINIYNCKIDNLRIIEND